MLIRLLITNFSYSNIIKLWYIFFPSFIALKFFLCVCFFACLLVCLMVPAPLTNRSDILDFSVPDFKLTQAEKPSTEDFAITPKKCQYFEA